MRLTGALVTMSALLALCIPFFDGHRALLRSMLWNLFLAALPLGFSLLLAARRQKGERGLLNGILWLLWLFFVPNAPYLLTDLMHIDRFVSQKSTGWFPSLPNWLGLMWLVAVIAVGCTLGALSVYLLHRQVRQRHGRVVGWLFCAAVSVLSGIGIYIGRFLRFNSWDVIKRPMELLAGIRGSVGPNTVGFCVIFTLMTIVGYIVFYFCFDVPEHTER